MNARLVLQRLLTAIAVTLLAGSALAGPEPLRPEQAFHYAVAAEGRDIIVRWQIEPGYYLYRERMSFVPHGEGASFGTPLMPEGELYSDEFFGEMHVYRGEAVVRIPVADAPADPLAFTIRSQGCADIGLCYPPQKWDATVTLAGTGSVTGTRSLGALLSGAGSDGLLAPEQAFVASAERGTDGRLRLIWDIQPGHYLYRDSLGVGSATPGLRVGSLQLPPGVPKEDESRGRTQVYYGEVVAEAALDGDAWPARVEVSYQGCREGSLCYPPQVQVLAVGTTSEATTPASGPGAAQPMVSEQDRLAAMVGTTNLALVMLSFAGFGLLLSFTPCCLPMIPILSGIIVGQGDKVTTGRAFALSLTYVLGMALTYTLAGAAFAAAGGQVQAALQQPWVIIGVAALFIVLALPMFGLFEVQVPAALMNRVNAVSGRQAAGTFLGTAIMGALSALVVTTCVAPPLVAALTIIAQTGDTLRGALALFALAMGMGLPLLAIGASAGKLLPKAGAWMNTVKGAFGFMMLGLAIWMLGRLLPAGLTMALWAVLIFMAGVFLGAFQALGSDAPPAHRLAKGAGLLAAIYGVTLLVGALAGGENPLQPLATLQAGGDDNRPAAAKMDFRRIKTIADLERTLTAATQAGQPVMLDFYADWCASCIEMERYTFSHPGVQAALAGTILLQADVTANDADDQALLRHFGIFGPPSIIFFGRDGLEREGYRLVGFSDATSFAAHVRHAIGS
ncbi:MAG: protein-disulfide reductase DsbD [Gammaproteobacteria bacterium]|nr:protein-disulfide reductase DsbD [Gammaproteobacteria bacterium]